MGLHPRAGIRKGNRILTKQLRQWTLSTPTSLRKDETEACAKLKKHSFPNQLSNQLLKPVFDKRAVEMRNAKSDGQPEHLTKQVFFVLVFVFICF